MKKDDNSNVTIESGLSRLDDILAMMESKDTDLSESFAMYEEGMKLLKTVNEQIDAVEKKVMVLKEDGLIEFDSDEYVS